VQLQRNAPEPEGWLILTLEQPVFSLGHPRVNHPVCLLVQVCLLPATISGQHPQMQRLILFGGINCMKPNKVVKVIEDWRTVSARKRIFFSGRTTCQHSTPVRLSNYITLHCTLFLPRGKLHRQISCSKGCQNPTPCWTRQIQARPNQPWGRCSVFLSPHASWGQLSNRCVEGTASRDGPKAECHSDEEKLKACRHEHIGQRSKKGRNA
jgi:hypothetical protein